LIEKLESQNHYLEY